MIEYFIVKTDRSIEYTQNDPVMLEDNNVTTLIFQIPAEVGGLDSNAYTWWFVFENGSGEKFSSVLELEEGDDEEVNSYTAYYTVGYGFTKTAGAARFALEAIDANETGEIDHEWHTRTYEIKVIDTLQGNQIEYAETESDVISALLVRVRQLIAQAQAGITGLDATGIDAGYVPTADGQDGWSWESQSGGGLTEDIKQSLLNCFNHVAWIDEHGQDYVDALEEALYPPASLVRITARYTQSGTVYDNQSLDDLKSNLVVTAIYDNGTSEAVTTYTLSGSLVTGESIITVAYGGKTATFTVTVTHATVQYSITNTLTNCTNSNSATAVNEETAYTGTLTADSGYIMGTVGITMGGTDITSTAYNSETGAISIASVTGNVVITAEAVEDVGWISGVPYDIDWGDAGYYVEDATGEVLASSNQNDHVTPLLPCHGASAILASTNPYGNYVFYDENQNYLYSQKVNTNIENPGRTSVPRNAYYVRGYWRGVNGVTVTPLLFPKLTESTPYQLDTYYSLEYDAGTEASSAQSHLALCYGAKTLQTDMYQRSWIYFYDAEKATTGNVIRQLGATEITIPDGTYYIALYPGTVSNNGNTNNPWVKFTS